MISERDMWKFLDLPYHPGEAWENTHILDRVKSRLKELGWT
jgi:hypothetical protein